MIDLNAIRLLHPHGDRMVPMNPRQQQHDPSASDPEREWLRHGRVYACECGEEVAVVPAHVDVPPKG